jgi:hypothetical protein
VKHLCVRFTSDKRLVGSHVALPRGVGFLPGVGSAELIPQQPTEA